MFIFLMLCLTAVAIAVFAWAYLHLSRKALDESLRTDNEAAGKPLVRLPQRRRRAARAASRPSPPAANPVAASGAAPSGEVATAPAAPPAANGSGNAPAAPEGPLFTAPAGEKDKLTAIKGIGPVAERQLNEQGITTFAQIAGLTDADIERIDATMSFSDRQIRTWQKQARQLI